MVGPEVFTIIAIPLGTALLVGVLAERLGAGSASGLASMGGLGLGAYFLHKVLELIPAS